MNVGIFPKRVGIYVDEQKQPLNAMKCGITQVSVGIKQPKKQF